MTTSTLSTALPARVDRWKRLVPLAFGVLVVAYLCGVLGVAQGDIFVQNIILVAAIFAVLAMSLDLVAGGIGLYSLGHAGLFALGAYTTALLNQNFGIDVFLALPISIVSVGLVGAILGALSLRVSGLYFSITTFIFTLVVAVVITNNQWTGGAQGIAGPNFPSFPPELAFLGNSLAWAVGGVLLLTIVVVWSIRASAFYPVLLAIRDAEPFAASNGVRVPLVKVMMFALSAGIAGMAGWAFSFLGFISPAQFGWTVSVNILAMVILGGINTRLGPIVGAIIVSLFPVIVQIDPFWRDMLFGLIFILVIVFLPEGLVGLFSRLYRRFRDRGRQSALDRSLEEAAEAEAAPTPVAEAELVSTPPDEVPPLSEEYALEASDIVYSYLPGVKAVDGVRIRVRRGSIHGLIGPNGSGKSTLVNLIAGHLRPQQGTITINGVRAERSGASTRASIGLNRTFQSAVMVKELSLRENTTLGLYATVRGIAARSLIWPLLAGARRDHQRMRDRADAQLQAVGLEPAWSRARVADVPHGVEQLTQLAAAGVAEPRILVLDEPLAGLSAGEVEHVSQILYELRRRGVTVIVVEHQTRFIFDVCDEVTVLAAGELITSGPAEQVRMNERVREVYLGQ
jgi:branched-chain amino acid transport system permease protein